MSIIQELKTIKSGTKIPKPAANADFIVKGWGKRRGHEALIYFIPNHKNTFKPYEKGINVIEWEKAFLQLKKNGSFSRDWFNQNLPECAYEGGCNFTTIGGLFHLLGYARYERGIYMLNPDKISLASK